MILLYSLIVLYIKSRGYQRNKLKMDTYFSLRLSLFDNSEYICSVYF